MSFRKGLHPVVASRQMVERAKQQNRVGGFVWFGEISGVAHGGLECRRFASLLPGLLNQFRGHVDELDVVTVLSEWIDPPRLSLTFLFVSSWRMSRTSGNDRADPTDPVGRLLFNVLAMVAEFESDLIRLRSRIAKAKGRLRGKQPKLKPKQSHLLELHDSGSYTQGQLAELFGVGAIYRPAERVVPDAPAERVDRAVRVT
jgi:hypothetical protein